MNEVIERLKNWLDKVYDENIDVACLELPILEILIKKEDWFSREEIIEDLKEYGDFKRGGLSFDHLWSHRFGKGEESSILNELVEHDGVNAGDVKTKYKIHQKYFGLLENFFAEYEQNTISLIQQRIDIMSNEITKEYEEFFHSLADKYDLKIREPHLSSGRKYFQIYPKFSPREEGTAGTHYEFNSDKGRLFLSLHLEKNIKNRPELKSYLGLSNPNKKRREYDKVDLTNSSENEIETLFSNLVERYENKINQYYLLNNKGEDVDEWQRRQTQFREWAINTVKSASSINSYISHSMNNKIPQKLIELGEKDKSFESIFEITDISWLEKFYERLIKGDLKTFNENTANQQPSASIKKYIEFLAYIKDNSSHQGISSNKPLNQILYGPPGTGKTYHTIDKAIEIIENRKVHDDEDRDELKKQFNKYKTNGQIEFVTFHQSYGYEEFVEGIKADVESEEIKYKLEDGIFKKLSEIAKQNFKNSKVQGVIKKSFEMVFQDVILDKLTVNGLKIYTARKHFTITDITERTIFFEKVDGQTNHSLCIKTLKEMYENETNTKIKGGLSVYYEPILNLLLENAQADVSQKESLKNYILIIDEINRGNISKIFGELITLIEDTKRLGKSEEVEITLPYSGKKFGVPSNLYILGTMNTADRSIALMDTALRRRFEFEEMMPDLAVLSNNAHKIVDFNSNEPRENDLMVGEINIRLLLKKINQRIEYLYDRDHTIGHAYFMSLKDKVKEANDTLREKTEEEKLTELGNIFRNKIIPLLQEYFYDDWEKIQIVLGDHPDQFKAKKEEKSAEYQFVIDNKLEEKNVLGFDHPDIEDDSVEYTINSEFGKETYIKIYGTYPSVKMNDNEEKTVNVA